MSAHIQNAIDNIHPIQPWTPPAQVDPDTGVLTSAMPKAEARALLASWISDARAVEDAPTLRRLDSGQLVKVSDILQALKALDDKPPANRDARHPVNPHKPFARRQTAASRRFSGTVRRSHPGDDDPPPGPANLAVPYRRRNVDARAMQPSPGILPPNVVAPAERPSNRQASR